MSYSNYSIGLQRLKPVHTAYGKLVLGTRRKWSRPRRDVGTSRDRLETETSRSRPQPWEEGSCISFFSVQFSWKQFYLFCYDFCSQPWPSSFGDITVIGWLQVSGLRNCATSRIGLRRRISPDVGLHKRRQYWIFMGMHGTAQWVGCWLVTVARLNYRGHTAGRLDMPLGTGVSLGQSQYIPAIWAPSAELVACPFCRMY